MRAGADIVIPERPSCADQPTIASIRHTLAERFRAAGIDTPALDARILVGHALSLDHAALAASGDRILGAVESEVIIALAARRLAREPVARILGRKEFWSLQFAIDCTTLVPRPETETVVEAALAVIDAQGWRGRKLHIADLGTGSGALLLALLSELPNACGIGTDNSVGALRVARDNARRLGLSRAAFAACDMTAALGGTFDLIVANPPYIPSADIAALAPEVRDFDPYPALDGGPDGLACYRVMAETAPARLKPGGALVVEFGPGQARPIAARFATAGLAPSQPRTDLHGVPRALIARKTA